jgi:hypothetical protein
MAQVVSLTRPQLAPNGMQFTEWMLRALDGLGLTPLEMLEASLTIVGFGQGIAMAFDFERQAERETGISSEEWMQGQEAQAARLFATGRFPMIARVGAEPDLDVELEHLFEFGLGVVLDGIERLVATAARRAASPATRRAASPAGRGSGAAGGRPSAGLAEAGGARPPASSMSTSGTAAASADRRRVPPGHTPASRASRRG